MKLVKPSVGAQRMIVKPSDGAQRMIVKLVLIIIFQGRHILQSEA
jgi:hypothetical protein